MCFSQVWPRVQRIQAIALNTQKFKCIFLNKMVLMDSTAFLDASLNTLTDTLAKSGHEFGILKQWRGLRRMRGGEIDDGATDGGGGGGGGGFEAEVGDGEVTAVAAFLAPAGRRRFAVQAGTLSG